MAGDTLDTMATREVIDDTGIRVLLPHPVCRVVSLVPSLTEAIAATKPGLLVGATAWCTHPPDLEVTRVRGTKNPDLPAILELRPDVVVVNVEENREPDAAALQAAGIPVYATDIRTVAQALDSLSRLVAMLAPSNNAPTDATPGAAAPTDATPGAAAPTPRTLTANRPHDAPVPTTLEPAWLRDAREAWSAPVPDRPRRRAIIPIWRRPWMAVGSDTFAGDLLARFGIDNVLADHPERYPRVDPNDYTDVDLVVLPDEPYAFTADDGPDAFPGMPCALVSGRHLTWYGPSLADARRVLLDQLATPIRLSQETTQPTRVDSPGP